MAEDLAGELSNRFYLLARRLLARPVHHHRTGFRQGSAEGHGQHGAGVPFDSSVLTNSLKLTQSAALLQSTSVFVRARVGRLGGVVSDPFMGPGNTMAAALLDETEMMRSNSRRSALLDRCSSVSLTVHLDNEFEPVFAGHGRDDWLGNWIRRLRSARDWTGGWRFCYSSPFKESVQNGAQKRLSEGRHVAVGTFTFRGPRQSARTTPKQGMRGGSKNEIVQFYHSQGFLALWVFLTFVAILIGWGDIDLYRQFDAPPNFWVLSLVAVWVGLPVPEFRI